MIIEYKCLKFSRVLWFTLKQIDALNNTRKNWINQNTLIWVWAQQPAGLSGGELRELVCFAWTPYVFPRGRCIRTWMLEMFQRASGCSSARDSTYPYPVLWEPRIDAYSNSCSSRVDALVGSARGMPLMFALCTTPHHTRESIVDSTPTRRNLARVFLFLDSSLHHIDGDDAAVAAAIVMLSLLLWYALTWIVELLNCGLLIASRHYGA